MIYNEGELQAAIEEGERKLATKRQKRRSDQRRLVALCVLMGLLLPYSAVAGIVAGRAPSAPSLVVTWPKPKVRQVLAPGQTLLARAGQPFTVEVTNPENWEVTWRAGIVESLSSEFDWAPSEEKSSLTASCRAKVSGWQTFFAWTWPRRDISLQATSAQKVSDYGRSLEAGSSGAWIYPHVFAAGSVQFDERALPLLASAISVTPQSALSDQLAAVETEPTPQLWQIVADFEGDMTAKSDAIADSTFAAFHAPDVATSLPQIAGSIVKSSPEASVKFVLRLDKDPSEGILRIAFDGKKERRAWIRRAGESAGGPFTGWENGEAMTGLLPSLPNE
jgi:hypothetical protein